MAQAQTLVSTAWNSFVVPSALTAQKNVFVNNVAALANLNPRQLLGISILALCYVSDNEFGARYVGNLPLLVTDATHFFGGTPVMDFPVGNRQQLVDLTAIDWNDGNRTNPALSTNVATLLAAIGFLQDTPENTLWQYRKFLTYVLSCVGL